MDAVTDILSNPVLRAGLGSNMAIGLEVATLIYSKIAMQSANRGLLSLIDRELAYWAREYSTTQSVVYKRELEIRIHTILGILNEWEKVT